MKKNVIRTVCCLLAVAGLSACTRHAGNFTFYLKDAPTADMKLVADESQHAEKKISGAPGIAEALAEATRLFGANCVGLKDIDINYHNILILYVIPGFIAPFGHCTVSATPVFKQ